MRVHRRLSRSALAAAVAVTVVAALATAVPVHSTANPASQAFGLQAWAHTAGRVQATGDSARYTWPGVYFEGRFRGTGVGIVLDDSANDYDVQVDGTTVATLVTPGRTTHWISGLTDAVHAVRVVKRSESPGVAGRFGGFVAAPGGAILTRPKARTRQVEFIGDSFTAGYGNTSATRDCSANGGVDRNTNADLAFGALTARGLDADYQLNAYSGLGMVRNHDGSRPEVDFRTYYDRVLQDVNGDVWRMPGSWRPQVVVIGLGINDFSTAVKPGERWTPESLVADYKTAYQGFIDKLRARYGPDTTIVVGAVTLAGNPAFVESTRQIVEDRNNGGDDRVRHWNYDDPRLDYLGCDWHPSLHDHRIISDRLNTYLAGLPLTW